jgi:hypothetical protein
MCTDGIPLIGFAGLACRGAQGFELLDAGTRANNPTASRGQVVPSGPHRREWCCPTGASRLAERDEQL